MMSVERSVASASFSLRGARRASRRVRARPGASHAVHVSADAGCSTPVGWKGDLLTHSSIPLLPNGETRSDRARKLCG